MSSIRKAIRTIVLAACFYATSSAEATEPSDASATQSAMMSARIDELLEAKLTSEGFTAAALCSDATFLRRAVLDLTGRNPSASEVVSFIENPGSAKREQLVERLLESPQCAVHFADTWSMWLLPDNVTPEALGGRAGLHAWLRNRFSENLRYDRLVADLLVASGSSNSGPSAFVLSLEGKPEKLAAKTSRVFLGVQLDCAECHDHPFDHWKQRDFWGFAAYFARLSADPMRSPGGLPEVIDQPEGEVTLPGTDEIVPPQPLVATGLSGIANGTRRQQLTLWLTARENPYLARAAVNRAWSKLFGRGLIEPIDDMRSIDMATHPELLSELSVYFAKSGYDLRELFRTIVNSKAYQRDNRHRESNLPLGSYAVMPLKPLTNIQLANCVRQVARDIAGPASQSQADQLAAQLGRLRGDGGSASLGIVQALVTLHSSQLVSVYDSEQSRLLQALSAPHLDKAQKIKWLFLSTVCRPPTDAEVAAFMDDADVLSSSSASGSADPAKPELDADESVPSWQADLLWALINSTEFAMTP